MNAYKKNMWANVIELMQTIDKIPGMRHIPDYEIQYNTQFLTHMSECFLNEYNHSTFTKRYYCEVTNSVYIQNALKKYSSDKMRRFDKAICKCASKKNYIGTLIWLHISKIVMYLRK